MLVIVVGYTFCVPRKGEPGGEKLREYRAKRDFAVTAEPAGAAADAGGARFVVQRHRARRLHYDFRLEVDGVLASWAVPRGPSLDPAARQLAVHVEDHPIEYADFEGVIPRGQYGGGDVIVWDRGTWTPAHTDDPATAIRDGELHFDLTGEKLAGRFALIRRGRTGKDEWLLVHKNDEHARHGWTADDHPRSVLSGRTNDEVAAAPDALWQSGVPAAEAEVRLGAGSWEPPTDDELAALDAIRRNGRWSVAGRDVKLTNLDKVLFPGRDGEPPVTKRELVRHYATVGPLLLPYLAGRPVNMHRFPEGVDRQGFWQQELPAGAPEWVTRWHDDDPGPDTAEWRVLVDGVPTLAWLANLAAVELHPWTGRLPEVRRPAWALIDIDPGPRTTFDRGARPRPPVPRRAGASRRRRACPRSPASAASRSGCRWRPATPTPTRVAGWRRCRRRSAARSRSWSAGSGPRTGAVGGRGWTTPRTWSTRRWSRRGASGRGRGRRCRCRSRGRSSTTPTWHRTAGPSGTSRTGSGRRATRSPR